MVKIVTLLLLDLISKMCDVKISVLEEKEEIEEREERSSWNIMEHHRTSSRERKERERERKEREREKKRKEREKRREKERKREKKIAVEAP